MASDAHRHSNTLIKTHGGRLGLIDEDETASPRAPALRRGFYALPLTVPTIAFAVGDAQTASRDGLDRKPDVDAIAESAAEFKRAKSSNFLTIEDTDSTPPSLSSSLPSDDQTNFPTSRSFSLTFNEIVERGTGTIALYKSNGALVESFNAASSAQLVFGGFYLEVDLTRYLRPDTSYYILISAGAVKDQAGNAFAGISSPTELNFHTQADAVDTTPPALNVTWPASGTVNVDTDTLFGLNFDEAIEAGNGTISIYRASDNSLYTTIATTDSSQVTFFGIGMRLMPTQGWQANTQYYVLVSPGAIEDKQGNPYAGISSPTIATFTTSPTVKIKDGPYTIAAGQVVNQTVNFSSIYVAYQIAASLNDNGNGLINYGQVTLTDTGGTETGVGPSFLTAHYIHFDNKAGATFSVKAVSAVGADVNYFRNDGTLTVSGTSSAQAVATGNFRNTGTIVVECANGYASGVVPDSPGSYSKYPFESFDNSGLIKVSGNSSQMCIGVEFGQASADIFNSGAVTVENAGGYSVGFSLPTFTTSVTFTNSGSISADVAVLMSQTEFPASPSTFTLNNSGIVTGEIMLDGIYDARGPLSNVVRNTGTIDGNIWLGIGDDVFDGRGGSCSGIIYGGDGDDTLIGGAGGDWFYDYSGNNVIDGGGGTNTLVLPGSAADYTFSTSGSVTTITGLLGRQTVTNIQHLYYSGASPSSGPVELLVSDLVIGAGQGITYTNSIANSGGTALTLTPTAKHFEKGLSVDNHGSIIAQAVNQANGVIAVSFTQSGMYRDCHFVNDGLIHAFDDHGGSVFGFYSTALTPVITNTANGSIIVSGSDAHGMLLYGAFQTFTNAGRISVTSSGADSTFATAIGSFFNGSDWTINNSGTFEVSSDAGSSRALVFGYPNCTVNNTGTITAAISDRTKLSIAIQYAATVVNSGRITADIAIDQGITVQNGGTIAGRITLQDGQNGSVVNNGTITGDIQNAAFYDGRNGQISGTVYGTSGSDTLYGGAGSDGLSGGGGVDALRPGMGADTVSGGNGNDTISFTGGRFDASDAIDGGAGNDLLWLTGDYSGGVVMNATTLTNVENIAVAAGFSYSLTTADATVGRGQQFSVDTTSLGASNSLTFNGAAETDGTFVLLAGAGADTLIGGGGGDTFRAGGGFDHVSGNGGNDTISFSLGHLDAADVIDGGTGTDMVWLNSDYTGANAVVFNATTLSNVETIALSASYSFSLTTADATVGAGKQLTVDGSSLGVSKTLMFNGSAETDGGFVVIGGAGTDTLIGGNGSDTLSGRAGNDTLRPGWGSDVAFGGDGDDIISFTGGRLNASDIIDGGNGWDTVWLNGDYAGANAATFNATTMTNVESIGFAAGFNYSLTSNNATVASGKALTIDASALGAANVLTFDGSAETNGAFTFVSGSGGDSFTGGSGADTFKYDAASRSTGLHYDTINALNFANDSFDIPGAITAIDAAKSTGALSTASFDTDLATALSSLGAHHAMLFTPNSGTLSGQTFMVVDCNGTAGYQAGQDLVIRINGYSGALTAGAFH